MRDSAFHHLIIQHAVWLLIPIAVATSATGTFEDLRSQNESINISYDPVRGWALKFGHSYARRLSSFASSTADQLRWFFDQTFSCLKAGKPNEQPTETPQLVDSEG